MAKSMSSLPTISFLLFLLISNTGGEATTPANAQKTWCVAKPSSNREELQANIEFACEQLNCGIIKKEGPCHDPKTLINRASVAMNLYYSTRGRNTWNCNFNGSGLIAITDPSYGSCNYA